MVFWNWENWREKFWRDFNFFFFLLKMKWEGKGLFKGKREGKAKWPKYPWLVPTCGPRGPHVDRGPLSTCGSRGAHVATMQGPFGRFVSRALPRFFGPYLGRPNSDFESVFGLRTVTPSRTTTTIQLWKMVEKSSRNPTMKSTQQMRTKSSIVNLFGLETLWMSNRNDRNSIRH